EAPDGRRYAFTSRELVSRTPGDTRWRPVRVDSPLARGFTEVNVEPDGTLSVVAWSALLTFDPRAATPRQATLETLVHRAAVRDADGVSTLLDRRGLAPIDLPPHRALVIEVGVNTADPGVQFRSRLVGIDDAYSPWSAVGRREFLALPPGDYVFEAEARTASGRVAKPVRLPFRVAPRWYQETWVRVALVLALLAITFALSRWYSLLRVRRIEAQNRNLESLIADRTRELERANRQLARLATLDGLTAVPNRRGFDSFLDEHWTQCRERGEPLSLLMIDVDHFKQYNDRHGHLAGDEALRAIAAELARFASGEDEILARFGGEEFAMVLAGQPLERAVDRAQYIRQHFEERANERNGLTLSIGVACAVPQVGHAPRQLIDEADAALYQAKRKGRNRVETQRALSA
ncbi:MAG TPA: diguanylate cyclase, partial [Xanthomonadales bacterium]|nr:diguanylate cyclase [Xanthomonadales bacterium]